MLAGKSSRPPHPRCYSAELPVTGAWRNGDPVGNRQFFTLERPGTFVLEGGGALAEVTLAYETWGKLAVDGSNAVLICHALTGDSHVAGDAGLGHSSPGWWGEMVGPGKILDTNELFVVCINVVGGCQGSTGPSSNSPATHKPYGSAFPIVTVRDIVRSQRRLADHLGIARWLTVVGGSMGAMQALEWGIMFPDRVGSVCALAGCMAASAQQIAWSAVGRTALALDPNWNGGDYYDNPSGQGPFAGLAIARSLAQITYRTDEVFEERFGRDQYDIHSVYGLWDRFQVESYLDYHGEKLAKRFDANTYLVLNRMMDLHDIGRYRGGLAAAISRLKAPVLSLSISSDTLYPPHQQMELHDAVVAASGRCVYTVVQSPQGHDGFLLETEAVGHAITNFLEKVGDDGA
ncbi:MAG: homoserine O-acetyltransferase [Acidimicrobiia bacterium]|nr:homoserine O-acetyltransferase [Acidimicrobiia bacterium]